MTKELKVWFTDFWPGFEKDNFFLNLLESRFSIKLDPNPDYLIFSIYGDKHLAYSDSIKICYSGENCLPDFNACDYGIGFDFLSFEDRYLRFPLYLIYPGYAGLTATRDINPEALLNRRFCNFVYSNSTFADPIREEFFKKLSQYKPIDSGGKHLNNIGYRVSDKLEFISNYKFTIAFENSSAPGYTTEKIMEPMRVLSLPIYWGNPCVHRDFNELSFINCMRLKSIDRMVEEVIRLDSDDAQYLERLSRNWLTPEQQAVNWNDVLLGFFDNIFRQPLQDAKRFPRYGFNLYEVQERQEWAQYRTRKGRMSALKFGIKKLFSGS